MAFCSKCGSGLTDGVAYCPQCGAPVGIADLRTPDVRTTASPAPLVTAGTSGLQENVAGMLCYSLGFVTGIIFLLIDKRPLVRFHAAQSIVVFGALFLLRLVLRVGILGGGAIGFFALWSLISLLLALFSLVIWIVLMVKTYQGKRVEVPIAAGIAKNIAGNATV